MSQELRGKVEVGGRSVVYSTSFICPEGEVARLSFSVLRAQVNVEISFLTDPNEKISKINLIGFENNTFRIKLTNWTKQNNGIVTPFPWEFASFGEQDKKLSLAAYGDCISGRHLVFIQFMLEDKK